MISVATSVAFPFFVIIIPTTTVAFSMYEVSVLTMAGQQIWLQCFQKSVPSIIGMADRAVGQQVLVNTFCWLQCC